MNSTNTLTHLGYLVLVVFVAVGSFWLGNKDTTPAADEQMRYKAQSHTQTVNFLELFISKVLAREGEIDFETRLALENAVRELDDEQALNAWDAFVESKTQPEAQQHVYELLQLLVNRMQTPTTTPSSNT